LAEVPVADVRDGADVALVADAGRSADEPVPADADTDDGDALDVRAEADVTGALLSVVADGVALAVETKTTLSLSSTTTYDWSSASSAD
jgi:hypothetical protein